MYDPISNTDVFEAEIWHAAPCMAHASTCCVDVLKLLTATVKTSAPYGPTRRSYIVDGCGEESLREQTRAHVAISRRERGREGWRGGEGGKQSPGFHQRPPTPEGKAMHQSIKLKALATAYFQRCCWIWWKWHPRKHRVFAHR